MVLKYFQFMQLVSDEQFYRSTTKLHGNSSHSTGNLICTTKDWVSSRLFNCVGKIQSCSGSTVDSWKAGRRWKVSGCCSVGHFSFRPDSSIIILGWRISNFHTPCFSHLLPAFPPNQVSSSPSSLFLTSSTYCLVSARLLGRGRTTHYSYRREKIIQKQAEAARCSFCFHPELKLLPSSSKPVPSSATAASTTGTDSIPPRQLHTMPLV